MEQMITNRMTYLRCLFNRVIQKKNTKVPCSMKIAPFMVLSLIQRTALAVREKSEREQGL